MLSSPAVHGIVLVSVIGLAESPSKLVLDPGLPDGTSC